jgi:hypothetical protein
MFKIGCKRLLLFVFLDYIRIFKTKTKNGK